VEKLRKIISDKVLSNIIPLQKNLKKCLFRQVFMVLILNKNKASKVIIHKILSIIKL